MCEGLKALLQDERQEGRQEGKEEGIKLTKKVYQLHREGKSCGDIAQECNITILQVEEILE